MNADMHLALYEDIARATDRMANAARAADWDALTLAGQECFDLVENARRLAPVVLDPPSRERKARLIRAMLANDAAVRAVAEPEMHRLQVLIQTTRQGEQARRAYLAEGPGGA